MPYTINTPKTLNKDADERLLTPEQMPDALNIHSIRGEAANALVLSTAKGNELLQTTLPEGTNRVVGRVKHEEKNDLYYFIANSAGNHTIFKYNSIENNITKVLQNSVLQFSFNSFVQGVAISLDNGQVLLYFTDKLSPPKKINVQKAILHTQGNYTLGYPITLSNGTLSQRLQFIEVLKYPPLSPPSITLTTDTSRQVNLVAAKPFQFAYRYIYDDGEASSYSPYSDVAISDFYKQNSVFTTYQQETENNIIVLTLNNAPSNVTKLEIIVRQGNNGDWRIFKRVNNQPNTPTQNVQFDNAGNYPVAPPRDVNNLFSNVPIVAKSLEIVNNRLVFANYVDGFDNIDIDIQLTPQYFQRPNYQTPIFQPSVGGVSNSGLVIQKNISFSGYTPVIGDFINIWFTILAQYRTGGLSPSFGSQVVGVYFQYRVTTTDLLTLMNNLRDAIIGSVYGGSQVQASTQVFSGNSIRIDLAAIEPIKPILDSVQDINSSVFIYDGFKTGIQSFKAGSFHPIGIAYYDRGNRSGTVQKATSNPYIKFFSERQSENPTEGLGQATIDAVINSTPPIWATKYRILYSGNSGTSSFLDYSTGKAYIANQTEQTIPDNNRIYISLNTLFNKENSYNNAYGANLSYNFVEGDRVRIISFNNGTERIYQGGYLDFKVLGLETYDNSNSPFYDDNSTGTKFRTTGDFLIIEDPKIDKWSRASIVANDTYWYKSNEGAFIQIYRPSSLNQDVYFEIAEGEILDAGTSNRRHGAEIRNQGEEVTLTITSLDTSNFAMVFEDYTLEEFKIVAGDTINLYDSSGNILVANANVLSIQPTESNGLSAVKVFIDSIVNSVDSIELSTLGAAFRLNSGDVWFKPRLLKNSDTATSTDFFIDFVEDYSINDFFDTASWNRGRLNTFAETSRQVDRYQSLIASDPFFTDTNVNGFSSFNLTEPVTQELYNNNGTLQLIKARGNDIICYQEDRVCRILVSAQIINSADGGASLSLSNDFFSRPDYYKGDVGIGFQPESFVSEDDNHYFVSLKKGKVCRLSNDGITEISEYDMRSFFYELSRIYLSSISNIKIYGGYDKEFDNYVVSFPSVDLGSVFVDGEDVGVLPNVTDTGTTLKIGVDIVGVVDAPFISAATEERGADDIFEAASVMGYAYSTIEDLLRTGTVFMNINSYNAQLEAEYINPNSSFPMYLKTGSGLLTGTLSITQGNITFSKAQADGLSITFTASDGIVYNTLSFSERANAWISRWSYEPEMFGDINYKFVSFKNGQLWLHNAGDYFTFYGVKTKPQFTISVNASPTINKTFLATEIQGNKAWEVLLAQTNLVETSIDVDMFEQKEGFWYAKMNNATTGSIDGGVFGLGVIGSFSGTRVFIDGFDGSMVNVQDSVYRAGVSVGIVNAIGDGYVDISSVSGLVVGDFLYVVKSGIVEGDAIRGYYCKQVFEFQGEGYAEVFAVRNWVNGSAINSEGA